MSFLLLVFISWIEHKVRIILVYVDNYILGIFEEIYITASSFSNKISYHLEIGTLFFRTFFIRTFFSLKNVRVRSRDNFTDYCQYSISNNLYY